jgi:hypothetical protein
MRLAATTQIASRASDDVLRSAAQGNPIAEALADLQATLADPKHTDDQVKQKVADVRSARAKAQAELDAARADVLPLLTSDQEATLVGLGLLD